MGRDLHAETAAKMFGVPVDQVTPEQRRAAKIRNFEILYGRNVKTFSEALNHSTNFVIQAQRVPPSCDDIAVYRTKDSPVFRALKPADNLRLKSAIGSMSFAYADYDEVLAKVSAAGFTLLVFDENEDDGR